MEKSLHYTLRHQIKIWQNISVNTIEQENWQEKFTIYAEITAISEQKFTVIEHLNFGHIMTEGFFIFKTRFIKNLSSKMRISFGDRQFEIKRLINIAEKSKWLNIIGLEIYGS